MSSGAGPPGDDPSADGGAERFSSSVSYVTGTSLASGELPGHDPNNTSMDTTASEHWEASGEEEPPSSPEKEPVGEAGGGDEDDDEEEEEVLETESDYDDEVLDEDDDDGETYEEVVVDDAESQEEVEEEEEVLVDEHGNEVTEELVGETEEVLAETEDVVVESEGVERVISDLAFIDGHEVNATAAADSSEAPVVVDAAPAAATSENEAPIIGADAEPPVRLDEDHVDDLHAFMDSQQFELDKPESFDTPLGDEAATERDDVVDAYESLALVAATAALGSETVDSEANREAAFHGEDELGAPADGNGASHDELAHNEGEDQTQHEGYDDPEMGGDKGIEDGAETAGQAKSKTPDMVDIILIIAIILVIVVLAVTLPFVLRRNDDDPTPSPVTLYPSAAPTAAPVLYSLVGGPFEGADPDSSFGFSSSLNADVVAVGAPRTNEGNGSVTTYLDINGWIQNDVLEGTQSDQFFGSSVNVRDEYLIVGAPGTYAQGSNYAAVGAAYVYHLERDSSSWTQVGSALRGGTEIESFNETFGASVAVSGDTLVAVVGAPMRNTGDGGVYTFRYRKANVTDWVTRTSSPLMIDESPSGGQFGSSVAITADGRRIIAGAPEWSGGIGYVQAYEWDDNSKDWSVIYTSKGETTGGRYGSSVTFLDFQTFAVGEPGALSGKGIIRVYQDSKNDSTFQQLGPDIEGTDTGDALGRVGTVSGASTKYGSATVLAASASGTVTRYVYHGGRWIRPFSTVSELGGAATSIGFGDSGDAFVVGVASANVASIYDTDGTMAPIVSPTPSPTLMPTSNAAPGGWKLAAYFTGENKLGSSVAIASNIMASGDSVSHVVETFQRSSDGTWSATSNLTVTNTGSRFGESLAIDQGALLLAVGAPRTATAGTSSTKTGAVYVYLSGANGWSQGTEIRGAEETDSDGEEFGSSIAVSSGGRFLVAGAPFNAAGGITNRGRVYVFEGSLSDSEYSYTVLDDIMLGTTSGDYFGSAVAISSDGTTLFVGAPGGVSGFGYVSAYSFNGSSWGNPVSTLLGSTAEELFGASLAVLADDGSIVAAGAPNFNGGVGAIRVFERQSDGTYSPLGDTIEGSATAMVGDADSISGSVDNGVPTLLVASSGGAISTYQFVSGAWIEGQKSILTGLQGRPAVQGSTALGSFVAGSRNQVVIYSE